ncbi:hypothetical protein BDF21DRAFT_418368 [Thamnidium elegans]|nr:hypothetical protein BDF21DRAFT_418368 [Thamnidium elegans]
MFFYLFSVYLSLDLSFSLQILLTNIFSFFDIPFYYSIIERFFFYYQIEKEKTLIVVVYKF